jgi:hypothetical protein
LNWEAQFLPLVAALGWHDRSGNEQHRGD